MSKTLVFGGARSGKSAYAEGLALNSGKQVIYVATAQAQDEEMAERIAHHQARRPAHWVTVEQTLYLAQVLEQYNQPQNLILIDCLTLWLSNCLFADGQSFPEVGAIAAPALFQQQQTRLLAALGQCAADVVLVSNEVGMGIVPMGAISRWFVDEAGRLNQALAQQCEQVVWVAAGLPLFFKNAASQAPC